MKISPSFLLIFATLNLLSLYAADDTESLFAPHGIFANINTNKPSGIAHTDDMFKSPFGRFSLMNIREGEILRANAVSIVPSAEHLAVVSSSDIYDEDERTIQIFKTRIKLCRGVQRHMLEKFAWGLALSEDISLASSTASRVKLELLERTRVLDLWLLYQVLTQDTFGYIKPSPFFFELLRFTHSEWPPKKNPNVHPTSAYTLARHALAIRLKNNINVSC